MKILIVSSVYPPETVGASRMMSDLAQELAGRGHTVTVLAPFPTRPLGTVFPGFEDRSKPQVSRENGVTVVRVRCYTNARSTISGRARESWSFGRAVVAWLEEHRKDVDVIYDMSWPVVAQRLVSKKAVALQIPIVICIMDVYPESLLIKLPSPVASFLKGPLTALDKAIVSRAEKIVVITEGMKKLYQQSRLIPAERIEVVPTWQDESGFFPEANREDAAKDYGVDARVFTFMYLGNIGAVAGVDHLIRSFHHAAVDNAQLLIVGDGSRKAACQELARTLGVKNVSFISDPNTANVPKLQSLADVFLLPIKTGSASSSIPSKLAAYLFSGKPILASVDSDSATAEAIAAAQCGWVGSPEDEGWLASQMRAVPGISAEELSQMGRRGRAFGLQHFSKKQGVSKLARIITGAVPRGRV